MQKSELLRALQTELRRHTFDTFVDELPSIAQGRDIVVSGCPACRKKILTTTKFMDHICDDVLPPLLDELSTDTE